MNSWQIAYVKVFLFKGAWKHKSYLMIFDASMLSLCYKRRRLLGGQMHQSLWHSGFELPDHGAIWIHCAAEPLYRFPSGWSNENHRRSEHLAWPKESIAEQWWGSPKVEISLLKFPKAIIPDAFQAWSMFAANPSDKGPSHASWFSHVQSWSMEPWKGNHHRDHVRLWRCAEEVQRSYGYGELDSTWVWLCEAASCLQIWATASHKPLHHTMACCWVSRCGPTSQQWIQRQTRNPPCKPGTPLNDKHYSSHNWVQY